MGTRSLSGVLLLALALATVLAGAASTLLDELRSAPTVDAGVAVAVVGVGALVAAWYACTAALALLLRGTRAAGVGTAALEVVIVSAGAPLLRRAAVVGAHAGLGLSLAVAPAVASTVVLPPSPTPTATSAAAAGHGSGVPSTGVPLDLGIPGTHAPHGLGGTGDDVPIDLGIPGAVPPAPNPAEAPPDGESRSDAPDEHPSTPAPDARLAPPAQGPPNAPHTSSTPNAPHTPGVPVASPAPSGPAPASARYVVRAGDSLWAIAAAHLHRGADDAAIAAAWPRWYAANASTIGPDPNRIHPGQILLAPTEENR